MSRASVHSALQLAAAIVRPELIGRRIALEVTEPDVSLGVPCTSNTLAQLVMSLLSNAVKFSPADGKICVQARRTSDEVVITVRDGGVGIEPSRRKRLMETRAVWVEPSQGSALNLGSARLVADALGGHIDADSAGPGRGSSFELHLPAATS